MAKCTIEFEDIDSGKYRVIGTPDVVEIAGKHRRGYKLTSAEAKFLLAMAAVKKTIIDESVDSFDKQTALPI